jgi:hypothetical protein
MKRYKNNNIYKYISMNEIIINEDLFDRVMALHMEFEQLISNPGRIIRVIRNLLVEVDNIDEDTIKLHLKKYYEVFPYRNINDELIDNVMSNNLENTNNIVSLLINNIQQQGINITIDNNINDNFISSFHSEEDINEEEEEDDDFDLDESSENYDNIIPNNQQIIPTDSYELFNQTLGSSILNQIPNLDNQQISSVISQEITNIINSSILNQNETNNTNTIINSSILNQNETNNTNTIMGISNLNSVSGRLMFNLMQNNNQNINNFTNIFNNIINMQINVNQEDIPIVIKKESLDTIPIIKFSNLEPDIKKKNPRCMISLDDFNDNYEIRILPCDHIFSKNNIDEWLLNNSYKCPICRMEAGEYIPKI